MPQISPFCLIEDRETGGTQFFAEPRAIIRAHSAAEVAPALAAMQAASEAGYHVAGAMAYECGFAFEPRLTPLLAGRSRASTPEVI